MTSGASAGTPLWSDHWAVAAAIEADYVEYQVRAAEAAGERQGAAAEAVRHHLEATRAACGPTGGRSRRRPGILDRWRGASVERAYRNLHAAKVILVDLLPQADVDALIPDVSARLAVVLDRNDPRRAQADRDMRGRDAATRRATLKRAMDHAFEASDDEYVRLRDFRNIIVLTTTALVIFTGILLAAVNLSPKAIPLCFEPGVTIASQVPGQQATTVCPSGDHRESTGGDVLIVAGLGAVGGGLGALLAIRNLRGTSTPYGVPTALAVLKLPAGALTAVIGMLLLAGGFVPGLSNLDSQRQILAYALLFGYGQQLVTRLADNQAQILLNKLPSKDSEAQQPAPPADAPQSVAGPTPLELGLADAANIDASEMPAATGSGDP